MNNSLDWDDLKVILAIAQTGSLSGAARALAVSHATVFRRLGEIERRWGVELFERSRTGYARTVAGEEAAATARRIEGEVHGLERQIVGRDLRPSGTVSVTTTDTLLHFHFSKIFARFRGVYPEIELEIAVSNDLFNLSYREADIALRPTSSPPEHLVGRKLGTITQAVYAHESIIDGNVEAWSDASSWVGPDERLPYPALEKWMAEQGVNARCGVRVNAILAMYAAIRDGAGIGILPCYVGESDPGLVRIGEAIPELEVALWLLTHQSLRRTARIRAFMEYMAEAAKDLFPGSA
ncbi:LysR family transcriptional regulator [Chelativorans sp. YIM 93263]|uniref:LysR family transcriptional regulator n=1 Tax=Chelativorans sp. YIM 93263 TaxID=2906648 RepID=UPI002378B346|nr:LysR family transcriptional regulator [Chelativorans sp. YIM 93263]